MSKYHQYTKGDDQFGGYVKPRCLSVTSIRKVMIIGGGYVKPRCLNVTSIRKVMIIGGGCVKTRVSKCHQYAKFDDQRWWLR